MRHYFRDATQTDISNETGIPRATIGNWCRKFRLPNDMTKEEAKSKIEDIAIMKMDGYRYPKIMRVLKKDVPSKTAWKERMYRRKTNRKKSPKDENKPVQSSHEIVIRVIVSKEG